MSDDNKQLALAEKELGNQAYKKREFETALGHYTKAFELDDTNITFLTNKAGKWNFYFYCNVSWILIPLRIAVLFEQENYQECIKVCEEAIERGRELRCDYKLIAR